MAQREAKQTTKYTVPSENSNVRQKRGIKPKQTVRLENVEACITLLSDERLHQGLVTVHG